MSYSERHHAGPVDIVYEPIPNFMPGNEPRTLYEMNSATIKKALVYTVVMSLGMGTATVAGAAYIGYEHWQGQRELGVVSAEMVDSTLKFISSPDAKYVPSDSNRSWLYTQESNGRVESVASMATDEHESVTISQESPATRWASRITVHEGEDGNTTVELHIQETWPEGVYYSAEEAGYGEPSVPSYFDEAWHTKIATIELGGDIDASTPEAVLSSINTANIRTVEVMHTSSEDRDGEWVSVSDDDLSKFAQDLYAKDTNNPYGLSYTEDQQVVADVIHYGN